MKTDLTFLTVNLIMAIIQSESIKFGKPVIQGTRVAVEDVTEAFYEMDRSIETIAEDFGLEKSQVEEALRYRENNMEPVVFY